MLYIFAFSSCLCYTCFLGHLDTFGYHFESGSMKSSTSMMTPASSLAVVIFRLCLMHISFFSDLYYVATTRFVGLRLFILLGELFMYLLLSGLFPVDRGLCRR